MRNEAPPPGWLASAIGAGLKLLTASVTREIFVTTRVYESEGGKHFMAGVIYCNSILFHRFLDLCFSIAQR